MSMLFPVMSWMLSAVQSPVVSIDQAMRHVEPSLKTSPGDGVSGVTAARARSVDDASRVVSASDANMVGVLPVKILVS